MSDIDTILDLTPSDFNALLRGSRLKRADEIARILENEALISKMNATDKKGKRMYKMKDVFDHKKEVNRILEEEGVLPKASKEQVDRFRDSKMKAEEILNRRVSKFE